MRDWLNWMLVGLLYKLTYIQAQTCSTSHLTEHRDIQQADYVIGGMFPVHYRSNDIYKYNPSGLMWAQAMLFAISEINNSTDILPNIKLGFRIFDSCNTVEIALKETLLLTQGQLIDDQNQQEDTNLTYCPCSNQNKSIIGLVGDAASATTTKVASLLTATATPQISYSATSTVLSNKYLYKTFMRTIPPDNFQAILITDLMRHFNWTYVNVIACDDDYGRIGIDELLPNLKANNICLAVYEVYDVKNDLEDEMTRQVMREIREETDATVVVLWCQRPEALKILRIAEELEIHNRTWIATEAYGNSKLLFDFKPEVVQGLFGIIPAQFTYQPFEQALKAITPNDTDHWNPWLHDYWLNYKQCKLLSQNPLRYTCPREAAIDLTELPKSKSVNVIDSVYAIAHALQNYLRRNSNSQVVEPARFSPYVKKVNFTGKSQTTISFNEQGNPEEALYSITNLQYDSITHMKTFTIVGSWNYKTRSVTMNTSAVQYSAIGHSVPRSSCTESCEPGFKGIRLEDKPCCWKCIQCPNGTIQPHQNEKSCLPCRSDQMPNSDRTKCLSPTLTYLNPKEKSGTVVVALMALGYFVIITAVVVFVKNRNTPIVKASNRGLSMLQITSMLFQLALPVLFIQERANMDLCGATLFYFIFFYTITVSVTFTKADRLLRVFEASKSGILAKHSTMKGNTVQYLTIFFLTLVGMALCASMFAVFRPTIIKKAHYHSDGIDIMYVCGGHYDTILFSLVAYVVVIGLVCTVYAFKARKLPQDFNEAKYTSYAMFIFLLTWIMAVPVYFSQEDEIGKSASWCVLCFVSTLAIFVPMYMPKCYTILFKSERNTKEIVRKNLNKLRIPSSPSSYSIPMNSTSETAYTSSISSDSLSNNNNNTSNHQNTTLKQR